MNHDTKIVLSQAQIGKIILTKKKEILHKILNKTPDSNFIKNKKIKNPVLAAVSILYGLSKLNRRFQRNLVELVWKVDENKNIIEILSLISKLKSDLSNLLTILKEFEDLLCIKNIKVVKIDMKNSKLEPSLLKYIKKKHDWKIVDREEHDQDIIYLEKTL